MLSESVVPCPKRQCLDPVCVTSSSLESWAAVRCDSARLPRRRVSRVHLITSTAVHTTQHFMRTLQVKTTARQMWFQKNKFDIRPIFELLRASPDPTRAPKYISEPWRSIILGWKRVVWCIDRYVQPFCCKRRQEKKKGKIHKVTRRYISTICGVETTGLIPIQIGVRVAPHDVIKISNFGNISRVFRFTRGRNPSFPIDFATHRYSSTALASSLWYIAAVDM